MMIIKQAPELRFKNSQSSAKGMPEWIIVKILQINNRWAEVCVMYAMRVRQGFALGRGW